MKKTLLREELLAEHAEALVTGDEGRRTRARLLARHHPDILALMDVAEQVRSAYRPLRAPDAFRTHLRQELVSDLRQRKLLAPEHKAWRTTRTYWVLGALASLLSVAAGGVGYYLHRRSQTTS